jgi:hypothetical protein
LSQIGLSNMNSQVSLSQPTKASVKAASDSSLTGQP